MDVPRLPISKVEKVFETKGKKLGSNTWVARRGWGQLLNCRMYTYISEKGTQVVLQSAFFLFHWISYQFLFILHKTSSSPLKIEGWKMEFDRLCSGSIYIYMYMFFFVCPFHSPTRVIKADAKEGTLTGRFPCLVFSWAGWCLVYPKGQQLVTWSPWHTSETSWNLGDVGQHNFANPQ